MANLAEKKCAPCTDGTPTLEVEEIFKLRTQLDSEWKVFDSKYLNRDFKFPDFKTALAFTNRVGGLAEREGHHPDISLSWGKVGIILFTHKINGLSESDFIMAAKIDSL